MFDLCRFLPPDYSVVEQFILFGLGFIVHVGKAVLWDFLTHVAQNPGCLNGACDLVLDVDAYYLDAAAEDKNI